MEKILEYLRETYHPLAILVYGSYAAGTQDSCSDFDGMLIVNQKEKNHDDSVIDGVQLDCFLFTEEEAEREDADTFLTAYDAEIIEDTGIGAKVKARVRNYVAENSVIDPEEKRFIAAWIRKTLKRVTKNDDEGNYRAITLLWESLTNYYLLRDMFYFGSKKAIAYLKANDAPGYALFHRAVTERSNAAIAAWADYVTQDVPEE